MLVLSVIMISLMRILLGIVYMSIWYRVRIKLYTFLHHHAFGYFLEFLAFFLRKRIVREVSLQQQKFIHQSINQLINRLRI